MVIVVDTGLTVLAMALLLVALATTNGVAEPVSQAIMLLQRGTTTERREATEILARVGNQQAILPLSAALHDADYLVRQNAEQALWSIWHRSGNAEVDQRLQEGIVAMQRGAFQQAVDIFTQVIGMLPEFAEAYNKRATTYYLMQQYQQSIQDCLQTITLNPVHFGALSGTGLNYMGLNNPIKALEYFQRAVKVNPNMAQIEAYITQIKRYLRDETL